MKHVMKHETLLQMMELLHHNSKHPYYCISNGERSIVYISPQLCELLGYNKDIVPTTKIIIQDTGLDLYKANTTKKITIADQRHHHSYFTLHILHQISDLFITSTDLVNFHGIRTKNNLMKDIFRIVQHVSNNNVNVLIRGETGTGKELIARAIHQESNRRKQPFIAVNCSAISPHLLESVLFGHKKGSFTGATRDHVGLFEQAHGGTLFLDEIGDMDLHLQSKLLRVLEERSVQPLGSTSNINIDVRILSATHRSLRNQVEKGLFRSDLMYRLRVVPIFLPPLRERPEDILPLFHHFLDQISAANQKSILDIEPKISKILVSHVWDGNIRELKNVVEYAVAVCQQTCITKKDLPPEFHDPQNRDHHSNMSIFFDERNLIEQTLQKHGGNIGETAKGLGMSRATLWRKRQKYN